MLSRTTTFLALAASTLVITSTQAQFSVGYELLASGNRPHASSVCLSATSDNDGARASFELCVDEVHKGNITWDMPDSGITGQIKTFNGEKCLDVPDGDASNGNLLQVWSCSEGNPNQLWDIGGAVDGQWLITWAGRNKCVDVKDGNYNVGGDLQIWDCDATNRNQWWWRTT